LPFSFFFAGAAASRVAIFCRDVSARTTCTHTHTHAVSRHRHSQQ
jgi:hypothetical protein